MKEPEAHYEIEDGDHPESGPGICNQDWEQWPCKTWRRWIKSKDYRIAELEAAVERLADLSARQGARQRDLERTVREDSNILRNGIYRAMSDLGRHGQIGSLTLDWQRDDLDASEFMSPRPRLSLPAELTVIYEDVGGRTWTNGDVTEQTLRGG